VGLIDPRFEESNSGEAGVRLKPMLHAGSINKLLRNVNELTSWVLTRHYVENEFNHPDAYIKVINGFTRNHKSRIGSTMEHLMTADH
jgi:hypothetical protein